MSTANVTEAPDHRAHLVATVTHAVQLAERDALVAFVWRLDMLLDGVTKGEVAWVRSAQFAGGRELPVSVFHWHFGQEILAPEGLAAAAVWFLAEAATRAAEEGASLALVSAKRVLEQWEALGAPVRVSSTDE